MTLTRVTCHCPFLPDAGLVLPGEDGFIRDRKLFSEVVQGGQQDIVCAAHPRHHSGTSTSKYQ